MQVPCTQCFAWITTFNPPKTGWGVFIIIIINITVSSMSEKEEQAQEARTCPTIGLTTNPRHWSQKVTVSI